MRWVQIARKDFADASRSMTLWILSGLMILLVAGVSAIPHLLYVSGEGSAPGFDEAMTFMFGLMTLMVSVIGLVVGYQAIVGERELGSIRFLLGLPNTRLDVVVGKAIGRAAVVAVPTVIGFLVGGVVIVLLYDGFDVATYVGIIAFSLLMGLVYVSVAVGVSASVSTRAKAIAGVLGIYVIFDWLWWSVPMALYWVVNRELAGSTDLPAWYLLVEQLGVWAPLGAISHELVDLGGDIYVPPADRIAGELPFYLETWFAWVFVAAWILIPLGIGYYRFDRAVLS